MKRFKAAIRFAPALLALAGMGLLGCSTDDPTSPTPTTQDPGDGTGTSAAWNITLTPDDDELASAGEDATTTITVRVVRASNGQPPPDGTTVAISVTNGVLGNGETSGAVSLTDGLAAFQFTATTEGTAVIQAQLESSVGRVRIPVIEGTAVFLLSHVEPNVGSPEGGEAVTIFGQNFREPVRVTVGGSVAQVTSVTSSRVRIITPRSSTSVPVGETQPATVSVTNAIGSEEEASDSLPNGFVYAHGGSFAEPQIFSVSPNTGPNEGGTEVLIKGTGFQSPVQVLFGDSGGASVEAEVLSVTESRIRALSPPARSFGQGNLNEQVDIVVINLDSGFRAVAPGAFRYGTQVLITSIGPGQGPIEGGQLVTLFGQGFDEPVAVGLAGVAQQVISVTGTEIVVRTVPVEVDSCNDVEGPSSVTNIETGSGAEGPNYTYRARRPIITGIDPSSSLQSGGGTVTISGSGFSDPVRVKFGAQTSPDADASSDGTTVTTEVPAFTGEFPTESCDDNGDGTSGERNLPASVTLTVTNLVTGCEDSVEDFFIYEPQDTSCRNDIGETEPDPECSDGIDNDGDGDIDFPDDAECTDADDDDESG